MYCLDYALALLAHSQLCRLWPAPRAEERGRSAAAAFQFAAGGAAGLLAAAVLAPFDVLRQQTVPRGASAVAWSTVPYMSVYLGAFHALRPASAAPGHTSEKPASTSLASTVLAATAASALASAAEL